MAQANGTTLFFSLILLVITSTVIVVISTVGFNGTDLICYKSPCNLQQAKVSFSTINVAREFWSRKCGYSGNVCSQCNFIDPSTVFTLEGIIRIPITLYRQYNESDIYFIYYQQGAKLFEYIMEYVLSDPCHQLVYITESVTILNIKYATMSVNFSGRGSRSTRGWLIRVAA